MGGMCDEYRSDNLRRHDTCIPSFMTIDSGIKVILRVLPGSLRGYSVGIADGRVAHEIIHDLI
jgi:hypothetical protein